MLTDRKIIKCYAMLGLILINLISSITYAATSSAKIVIGVSGDPEYIDLEKRLVNMALRNPALQHLKVEVVDTQYYDIVLRDMQAGKGPDIILMSANRVRMFADFNLIIDLNQIIAKDAGLKSAISRIYPAAMQSAMWRGKLLGIPRSMTLTGIVYNVAHLSDAGLKVPINWKWDDFALIGKKLQSREIPVKGTIYATNRTLDVTYKIEKGAGLAFYFNSSYWQPFLWSNDAEYIPESFRLTAIDSNQARETFSWIKSLISDGAAKLWIVSTDNYLKKEYVSMAASRSSMLAELLPTTDTTSLKMAPYPIAPHTGKSVGEIFTEVYAINKASTNIDSAIRLISELVSTNIQYALVSSGILPARSDILLPSSHMLPAQDVVAKIAATAKSGQPMFVQDKSLAQPVEKNLYDYLVDITRLDTFIRRTCTEVNDILKSWDGNPRSLWSIGEVKEIQIGKPTPLSKLPPSN